MAEVNKVDVKWYKELLRMCNNANFYKLSEEGWFHKITLANNLALGSEAENEPFPMPWTFSTTQRHSSVCEKGVMNSDAI